MKPKPEIAQYRRAYFAMLPLVGVDTRDDEARHRFNAELVGKARTGDWTLGEWCGNTWLPGDWDYAVSGLQRGTGMDDVQPGYPHLKGTWLDSRPAVLDVGATDRQMRLIDSLARQVEWRRPDDPAGCLDALVRIRVLGKGSSAEIQWHGSLATLDRKQASLLIIILDRLPKVDRLSETDSLPPADAGDCRDGVAAHGFSSFLARESDPETSQDAAEAAVESGRVAIDEQAIMFVLREASPEGMTGSEIAGRLLAAPGQSPWNNVRVMRRMAALIGAGKVHRIEGQRRDGQALHFYGPAGMPLQNAAKVPV